MVSKFILAKGKSTFFINGIPTFIDLPRKLSDPPSWIITFAIVSFNKISLFSKTLFTFITCFISFFINVVPESVIAETLFLIFFTETIKSCFYSKVFTTFFDLERT